MGTMTQQLYVQSNCMEVKRPKHLSSISFENQIWHCTSASGDEKKGQPGIVRGAFIRRFQGAIWQQFFMKGTQFVWDGKA